MRVLQISVAIATTLCAALASQQEPKHSVAKRWGTYTGEPEMPYDPYTARPCTLWYNNDGSQNCMDALGVILADFVAFLSYNPSIILKDADCINFNKGQAYCLENNSTDPKPTVYSSEPHWPTTIALITPTKTPLPKATKESAGYRLESAAHAVYGVVILAGVSMVWV